MNATVEYEPVIGLEIHVQLKTRTKMFCGCELSFGDEPNIHTCPLCLGLPGRAAGRQRAGGPLRDLMIGLALGCEIARALAVPPQELLLSRPAEGLPDLPVRRPALQRRAARRRPHPPRPPRGGRREAVHVGDSGRIHGADRSVVDFNRGGTPLVEIVTEPDLHSAEQAREWLNLLRATLRELGVSDVNMEEGSLRCDANVSVRPVGHDRARHQDRAQEHELVPLPRAGARGRDRAPDRAAPLPASRSCRRRCTSTRDRPADLAALQGGGPRLPLLPGARPGPLVATEEMLEAARARCPSCRPRARSASSASSGCTRGPRPGARVPDRARRLLRAGARRPATGLEPVALANWIPQLVERIGATPTRRLRKVTPGGLADAGKWWPPRRSAATPPARC